MIAKTKTLLCCLLLNNEHMNVCVYLDSRVLCSVISSRVIGIFCLGCPLFCCAFKFFEPNKFCFYYIFLVMLIICFSSLKIFKKVAIFGMPATLETFFHCIVKIWDFHNMPYLTYLWSSLLYVFMKW